MSLAANAAAEVRLLLIGRGLRAFVDGYVAVLLPAYLLALGYDTWHVGLLSTATLLGSALATLALGAWGHRAAPRTLLLVAFVGTLNPSAGDVSVFLPLEHARLSLAAEGDLRTRLFARYSLTGALCAAIGALAVGVPDALAGFGVDRLLALRLMFIAYAGSGVAICWLYARLPERQPQGKAAAPAPLGPSRGIVVRLAALFSVDAFAGGLVVNSMLALWLFERFGLSLTAAGAFFFWAGLLGALSQLAAPRLARRIGLLNTMVFTHIPSSLFLILAAFATELWLALALLLLRAALSQMDVPARSAYVMSVVTPPERAAAASFTAVPRSLAAALSPTLAGLMFAGGWFAVPLVACGVLKIAYDLALWRSFRRQTFGG